MLGPSIILLGTPIAFGVSVAAVRRATDRVFAIIALALSGLELLGLLALLCLFFLPA
jgi:hypothetical protein